LEGMGVILTTIEEGMEVMGVMGTTAAAMAAMEAAMGVAMVVTPMEDTGHHHMEIIVIMGVTEIHMVDMGHHHHMGGVGMEIMEVEIIIMVDMEDMAENHLINH